jgi:putative ATP-binding cassette transporter
MQEDCRLFAELTTELGVGMLNSALLLVSFIGVLWGLSSNASFVIGGREVTIPGYMVWVAIGYAGLGTGLTWLVGRPLIRLNTERYAREAELRFALVRVNESAESVALYSGEADERRNIEGFVQSVMTATRRLSGALAKLTWITSSYGWLAIVVPIVAAAPGYLSGKLSFGDMMMVVGAFNQVQTALRYFVDNFPKIADWRSAVLRVASFHQATADLDRLIAESSKIEIAPHPQGWLAFENVSIAMTDGSVIIEDATAEVRPGERVLIMGESGSGKSTLFRAIAGLWPWGAGRVLTPPGHEIMFLPQRPYLPLGTLRAAVTYPAAPDAFDEEAIKAALARCGLQDFVGALDRDERWDKTMSLGQQQRIAFARILLHRPKWVFMDEATSALDDENQAQMLSLFDNEVAGTSALSIGHRPGLEEFHTRTLHIRKTEEGAVLLNPRRTPIPRWAQWLARPRRRSKGRRRRAGRIDAARVRRWGRQAARPHDKRAPGPLARSFGAAAAMPCRRRYRLVRRVSARAATRPGCSRQSQRSPTVRRRWPRSATRLGSGEPAWVPRMLTLFETNPCRTSRFQRGRRAGVIIPREAPGPDRSRAAR